jgi:small-conductance mechanosensitive channel
MLKKEHLRPYIRDSSLSDAFGAFSPILDEVDQLEFIKAIDAVYAERRSLIKILGESDDLVHKLDQILMAIVGILGVMMLFPISGVGPILPIGISLAPMVVILTLAFADTIKSIVAAIVFIFSTHPFDIGDLVYMDRGTYFVRKVRLLSTLFRRWDGVYVYYPNSLLASMSICNVRRTGPQAIRFEVNLSMDSTSTRTIQSLQQKLLAFVEDNPTDYADLQPVLFELRPGLNRVVMVLKLRLQQSFQDPYKRVLRFNKFWGFAKEAMESLGITYETPTMQIQSDELVAPEAE